MKRTPLRPGKGPTRRAAVRPRNGERRASEYERAYGGEARRDFVASLPCLVCGRVPSDPAHVGNGGASRKGDADTVVPLCPTNPATGWLGHHAEYDGGKVYFVMKYSLDLVAEAARTEAFWLAHLNRE